MMLKNIMLLQSARMCWVIGGSITQKLQLVRSYRTNVGSTTVDQLLMLNCWVNVGPMSARQH